MSERKVFILLCISWIIPSLIPTVRYVDKRLLYAVILLVIIGTFMTICILYTLLLCLLMRKLRTLGAFEINKIIYLNSKGVTHKQYLLKDAVVKALRILKVDGSRKILSINQNCFGSAELSFGL